MSHSAVFQLGSVTLDATRNELSGPEGRIRLEPRVTEFAALLGRHSGEVVSRGDLIDSVWKGYPVVDQALTNAASKFRRALAESGGNPERLKTVSKRGYRLKVDGIESPTGSVLAVLPFRNLGPDTEYDYLCEGLAEELLNALGQQQGLRLIARSAAFALANADDPLSELRSRLDVDYVVEGGVNKFGHEIQVGVQLTDTHKQSQIWSFEIRKKWIELLNLQDELKTTMIQELRSRLGSPAEAKRVSADRQVDPEAYACYLKGRYFWERENDDPGKALEYFHKATEVAPDYAPPYAGLADCYCTYAIWQMMPQAEARKGGLQNAALALSLAPDSPEAQFSDGYTKFYFAWDWEGAETAFRKVLRRKPEHILANSFLGLLLAVLHRDDEVRAIIRKLLALDPVSGWCAYFAASLAYWVRDYEDAARWGRDALELMPGDLACLWVTSSSLARTGRKAEAMPLIRELEQNAGDADVFHSCAGVVYAECGELEEAERVLKHLRQRERIRGVAPGIVSPLCAILGRDEEALEAIRKSYEERTATLFVASRNPCFDAIRHRPEYQKLLRDLGLQDS